MSIDRALQWTTAAVAVVGALFLALGHESGWLPAILAVAAAISVLVTDLIPRLRLNRVVGNLIAIAAVAWSLYDFLERTSDQQLMAISQMLVILQVLLLFQEKSGRAYWQLLVLSLLQVVVAAALNSGVEFGVLLAVYMVLSLLALVLLCMHRDLVAFRQVTPTVPAPTIAWMALIAPPRVAPPALAQREARPPLGGRLLLRQLLALALATTGLTAVFFYLTPRLSDSAWRTQRRSGASVTGASQYMELEEFGRIHQSNQVVLRAILTNADGSAYTMIGDPYFQGGVLTHYEREGARSRWLFLPRRTLVNYNLTPRLGRRDPPRTIVRQEYILEMQGTPHIFAVFPAYPRFGSTLPGLRIEPAAGRIVRTNSELATPLGELRFAARTTALQRGRQLRGVSHANPGVTFSNVADLQAELEALREFDAERFPGLRAAAEQALQSAAADTDDPLAQALALERHFLYSKRYQYSLHLDFRRDPQLDPIEDFVVNHRTGHCEYFASALALMLRSQGIPARIVVGYKGGEYNMLGQYFVVRQKHAHAWVEAWMPPGAVPDAELANAPRPSGCWYRLDPTPSSNEYLAGLSEPTFQDQITDAFDYLELLWRDYVVNLNSLRQPEAVVDPAAANALDALPAWIDSRSTQGWVRRVGQYLGLQVAERGPQSTSRGVDWRLAALVVGGLAVVIAFTQFGAALRCWLPTWLGGRRDPRAAFHAPPAFYRRLEWLLARLRLRRRGGQTAREFAQAAQTKLTAGDVPPEVADLPDDLVQRYYRVRFGGQTLDNSETAEIEQALAKLVPAVSQAQSR